MAISREELEHVARLARLQLTDEEIELFAGQLGAVLERARRIQALPLDDLPPTAHPVELSNVLRDDTVVPCLLPDQVLDNAPEREGDLFRVPRILEEEP
jgi:aspartyl-tRNA(Asn)/glutamyl-tRNA(Gln) amidotransferase subunit C